MVVFGFFFFGVGGVLCVRGHESLHDTRDLSFPGLGKELEEPWVNPKSTNLI